MASRRIIFVLGGPGAGKASLNSSMGSGTQCKNLVRDFPSIVHLSAGDLLRTESADPDSLDGMLIDAYIKTGQIVPSEITIALLKRAIEVNEEAGKSTFLVDGFPRSLEQAERFEDEVGEPAGVLYFECSEEELLKRLAKRGETSGRIDDNPESIRKRFVTFHETSFPVITSYQEHQKVLTIPSIGTPEEVYELTKDALYKSNI
ncbi:adenylate kinase, partial [Gonapodya prolifera JEL478]